MSAGFIYYMSQFLPVALGIAAMVALRSVRGFGRRIRIEAAGISPEDKPAVEAATVVDGAGVLDYRSRRLGLPESAIKALGSDAIFLVDGAERLNLWRGNIAACEDIPSQIFRRESGDRLITAGRYGKKNADSGILDLDGPIGTIWRARPARSGKLVVFARDSRAVFDRITAYGMEGSLLLGMIVANEVEFAGIGNGNP